jgi:hypothetical protein
MINCAPAAGAQLIIMRLRSVHVPKEVPFHRAKARSGEPVSTARPLRNLGKPAITTRGP